MYLISIVVFIVENFWHVKLFGIT